MSTHIMPLELMFNNQVTLPIDKAFYQLNKSRQRCMTRNCKSHVQVIKPFMLELELSWMRLCV